MWRLWWPQLPLLIIMQLLEPSRQNHKVYVEALLTFKSTVSSPQKLGNWAGRSPCFRSRVGVSCTHKLKDVATFPLLSGAHTSHSEINKPSPCASTSHLQQVSPIQTNLYKSRKTRIKTTVGGELFTTPPSQSPSAKKPRGPKVAAIIGGCLGAALVVAVTVLLVYICLKRATRSVRRTSETASSAPSPPAEWPRGNGPSYADIPCESQNIRQLSIVELEHATSKFSQRNVIGEGGFGLMYKGLLQDGTIVAIKRRQHDPSQYFVQEVEGIASIHHKHLVKLIGFCQESNQQLLVYDYIPNGNVGNHLYDSEGFPVGKLDILQRLSIALGAAKGLEYLHRLTPPRVHMHFRTRNVLVDDNFFAKVSDFGVSKLLFEGCRAESSSGVDCFLDPELRSPNEISKRSDIYSFGVFLLELISGRKALLKTGSGSWTNLVIEAKSVTSLDSFVDKTLRGKAIDALDCMRKLALQCLDAGVRRPVMSMVVRELELIQERERGHHGTDLGEDITDVTLGSELFK